MQDFISFPEPHYPRIRNLHFLVMLVFLLTPLTSHSWTSHAIAIKIAVLGFKHMALCRLSIHCSPDLSLQLYKPFLDVAVFHCCLLPSDCLPPFLVPAFFYPVFPAVAEV